MTEPTRPSERTLAIDALRGWALVGIAVVNVPWIGFTESLPSLLATDSLRAQLTPWDFGAAVFVEGLCEGRFYPIFSALFGLGSGILIDRGLTTYARRIAALWVFGVLHATFGWWGDVLLNYALAGMLLAALGRLRAPALFGVAALLLAITQAISLRFDELAGPTSPEAAAAHQAYVAHATAIYRDGTFLSISQHRFQEMLSDYFFASYNYSYRVNVLAMATLGLAIERSGVHRRIAALRPAIGRLAMGLLVLGAALSASALASPELVLAWVYVPAGDVLAMGYALGFVWLVSRSEGAGRAAWARPFAAVGRMALTCYLLQTAAFTLFFYGYGLGMYGAIGPLGGLVLAVLVYAAEAVLATLWLERFEYGPAEIVWRALTYLRWPPLWKVDRAARV